MTDATFEMAEALAEQRRLDFEQTNNGLFLWIEVGGAIRNKTLVGPAPLIVFLSDRVAELLKLVEAPPPSQKTDAAVAAAMALKMGVGQRNAFSGYGKEMRDRHLAQLHDLGLELPGVELRTQQRAVKNAAHRVKTRTGGAVVRTRRRRKTTRNHEPFDADPDQNM